jgi:hypothetical protein
MVEIVREKVERRDCRRDNKNMFVLDWIDGGFKAFIFN